MLVSLFFGVSFSSFYVLLGVFVIAFSLYFVSSVSSVGIQFVGSVVSFGARCLDSLPRKQHQSGLAHSSRKRYCCFRIRHLDVNLVRHCRSRGSDPLLLGSCVVNTAIGGGERSDGVALSRSNALS